MDSLTQIALGAAVSVAVMRRRTAPWKAALLGAVAGTLPDLDVFVDHGDPILNMVLHRADSHALFWQVLASAPLGWLAAVLCRERPAWRWWWLAMALALVTHPLLDLLTVYGTQLARPFSDHPYALGSVFVIDPLVTLSWLAGVGVALALRGSVAGQRANLVGLSLGCLYLAWGAALQSHVTDHALASLRLQGVQARQVLVTPTPFNSLAWRVVAMDDASYHEGFYSLFDAPGPMRFDAFDRGAALEPALAAHDGVRRIRAFSHGFYRLREDSGRIFVTDLRMGQEPAYSFDFMVARRGAGGGVEQLPRALAAGGRPDPARALPWLWRRIWGDPAAPPR